MLLSSHNWFLSYQTSALKKAILNFKALENENFFACWERYMEIVGVCPHHGFEKWMLVPYFYEGMSTQIKQLLETMCGRDFMNKSLNDAFQYLDYVVDVSKSWEDPIIKEQ